MKPLIAQVITRMVPGGASQIVRSLIDGLNDRYSFDLICGEQDFPDDLTATDLGVNRLINCPDLVRDIHPLHDWRAYGKLVRTFRGNNYDLIHTHTSKAGFLGRLAGHRAEAPAIVHSPHGLIYLPDSQIPGVPSSGLGQRLLMQVERWAGGKHDALTALSEHEKELSLKWGLADEDHSVVIPNGIDLDRFEHDETKRAEWRNQFNLGDDDLLTLAAGRLATEKNYDLLIDSFLQLKEDYPHLVLVIAGEGPERASLKQRAGDWERDRILFPGFVEDMPGLYSAADLFVLPSAYEGFGLVLIEAMATGLPVVGSRVGGISEIIEENQSGKLFESGNRQDLTETLIELIDSDEKREILGERAKERAREFSLDQMVEKFTDLYDRLLSGK